MTPSHTRHKDYRNLYQANPITGKRKKEREQYRKDQELKKQVDEAWKGFWAKRGYKKPPQVSNRYLLAFDLPCR